MYGIASLGIAAVLRVTAIFFAREAKGLLIGEPAARGLRVSLRRLVETLPGADEVRELFTFQFGPDQVVALLNVRFRDNLSAGELAQLVARIQERAKAAHPELVFVNPIPRVQPD